MASTTQLILAWGKTGALIAGIFFVCYIIYLGLLKPLINKFKKAPQSEKLVNLAESYKDRNNLIRDMKEAKMSQENTAKTLELFDSKPKPQVKSAMEDEKVKWVKSAMEKGYKRKDIRKMLTEKGWKEEAVEKIVEIYNILKQEKKRQNISLPEL